MASQCTVVITGNVGQAPYINESGERPFATFSVAHTPYTKNEADKQPIWAKIVVNGPQVQVVKDYVKAGMNITVTGKVTKLALAKDKEGKMVMSNSGQPVIEWQIQSHEFTLGPKSANEAGSGRTMAASAGSRGNTVIQQDDDAPF